MYAIFSIHCRWTNATIKLKVFFWAPISELYGRTWVSITNPECRQASNVHVTNRFFISGFFCLFLSVLVADWPPMSRRSWCSASYVRTSYRGMATLKILTKHTYMVVCTVGFSASTGSVIGAGSVSDLFSPQDRAIAMSVCQMGTVLGECTYGFVVV